MEIKLPSSLRKKALFIIDVQPQTLTDEAAALIPFMAKFIAQSDYAAYVEANYFADENSMFFKQGNFLKTKETTGPTAPEIKARLQEKRAPHFFVSKTTRSCFKGPDSNKLFAFLRSNEIEEIHFIGFDINDCVLASAFEAIDLGYFTYVLEELCHHSESNGELKAAARKIFREQSMLNDMDLVQTISLDI
jgi:nicotinamidase-related amidase